jgi:TonB family protein
MTQWQRNLIVIAFLVSVFLHFGTGLYVYLTDSRNVQSEPIEITIVDKQEEMKKALSRAQQIVEQSEQRVNDEIDEKAKYLSRHNQKVLEETRAANSGRFQNDAKQGPVAKTESMKTEKPQPKEKQAKKTADKKAADMGGDMELPKLAALKPQFKWEKVEVGVRNPGPLSQTDDHLKNLPTGPQTLLSSREFVYYTYYSRIKERLRLFWEPKIREKITRLFMSGRRIASDSERITKLVITLDDKGTLVRVQVLGESGLKDLDDAAIEAFQSAAPFPNPPTGIVDSDGTIKIRWDFVLEASA